MGIGYAIAYRLGVRPWERAGAAAAEQFTGLLEREEAERRPPYGRALDLGCGTGAHAIELARRGWTVTGVDATPQAVQAARMRPGADAASVTFVDGDVTALRTAGVGTGFGFLLDVGCFHGLRDEDRAAMAAEVDAVATADATVLMLAFSPARRGPLPRGAGRDAIEAAFAGWGVIAEDAADVSGMPGPLKKTAPRWYRLRRR